MIFGQQLRFASDVINASTHPANAGGPKHEAPTRIELAEQISKVVMQIVISIGILVFCLYLLKTSNNADVQKACTGFIGTVLGYWLR